MLVMLVVKVWIGLTIQSLSLLSEALHTVLVGFSILLSLVALPYPAHRDSWGHRKLESVLTLLLLAFMGFACCNLVGLAIQHTELAIANPTTGLTTEISLPLIQLFIGVTAVSFGFGIFGRYQVKQLSRTVLEASVVYSLRDAGLMVLVLLGFLGVNRGFYWLDPLLTVLMVSMAIATAWQILNRQLPSLLRQVAIAPEALIKTIHQVEGIIHCYGIQSRGIVGRMVYVEMRLILHPEYLAIAQVITERVERLIRQQYGSVRVVVDIDRDRTMMPEQGKE